MTADKVDGGVGSMTADKVDGGVGSLGGIRRGRSGHVLVSSHRQCGTNEGSGRGHMHGESPQASSKG